MPGHGVRRARSALCLPAVRRRIVHRPTVRRPTVRRPTVRCRTGRRQLPCRSLTGWRRCPVPGATALGVVGVVTLTLVLLQRADPATVARHDYRFTVPDGWSEAGGDPDLLEVRIAPDGSAGPEAVLVQQTRLSYDSATTPRRGPGEIAELLAAEDPAEYSGFDSAARFAGRDVVRYRQRPGDGSTVEWYVLFERTVQVSIGCRAKPAAAAAVERACRNVVASLQAQP